MLGPLRSQVPHPAFLAQKERRVIGQKLLAQQSRESRTGSDASSSGKSYNVNSELVEFVKKKVYGNPHDLKVQHTPSIVMQGVCLASKLSPAQKGSVDLFNIYFYFIFCLCV